MSGVLAMSKVTRSAGSWVRIGLALLAGIGLVIVGALNWGLVGVAKFNLVTALFGNTILSSIVFTLVGLAGVYQLAQIKAMQRRWHPVHA